MIKKIILLLFSFCLAVIASSTTVGASNAQILITQVLAGASSGIDSAATMEYISIYNNTDTDIEITNWCLTNKSQKNIACFTQNDPTIHMWLTKRSHATVGSTTFSDYYKIQTDIIYAPISSSSGSITGSSDVISLVDNNSTVVDSISWNTTLTGGRLLERKSSGTPITYQDNDLSTDFNNITNLSVKSSGLFEEVVLVDVCKNIDGVQLTMPNGYDIDSNNDCIPDACKNLAGLQNILPAGMKYDNSNNCVEIDLCLNISGSQLEIPFNYIADDYSNCYINSVKLLITEILPNPLGLDTGKEFIEIYNPTSQDVDLSFYKIAIGIDSIKYYSFPIGSVIKAGQYFVLYNSQVNYTLINTVSLVGLFTQDNQEVFQTQIYLNSKDGESWSLIDNLWQYTNQPSPGKSNLMSVTVEDESAPQPCAPNQYRNPETNRCKLITVKQASLTPCKDGEYRSETTNRCRSISSEAKLVECSEGEFRNPETNRCKKEASLIKTDYPTNVEATKSNDNHAQTFLIVAILITSLYAIWEWRFDLSQIFTKIQKFIKKRK